MQQHLQRSLYLRSGPASIACTRRESAKYAIVYAYADRLLGSLITGWLVRAFSAWRRTSWLERKLTARRLAEALERLPPYIAEVERGR